MTSPTASPSGAPSSSEDGAPLCSKCGVNERAPRGSWCPDCKREYQRAYNAKVRPKPRTYIHPCERWGCCAEVQGVSGKGPYRRYCSRECNDLAQQQKLAVKQRVAAANRQVRIDMHARGERRCSTCKEVKSLEDFHRNGDLRNLGYQHTCKACVHDDHVANPEKLRRRSWISHLKRKYNLTLEQWSAMLIAQVGLCAICGSQMMEPHTDHDHQGGDVRGLLCNGCNTRLHDGVTEEWFEAAAKYLFG